MSIRYVTVDWAGHIYEVSNLFDRFAQPTLDPDLAVSCVIKLADNKWHDATTDGLPIYTVH